MAFIFFENEFLFYLFGSTTDDTHVYVSKCVLTEAGVCVKTTGTELLSDISCSVSSQTDVASRDAPEERTSHCS